MTKRKKEYEEDKDKENSESAAHKRSRIINSIEKKHKFLTLKDSEDLLYFNPSDGQWHDGDVFLKQLVDQETTIKVLPSFGKGGEITSSFEFTTSMFREIKEIIKIHSYADPKEFVSPPEWINLKNGALNVSGTEFIPREPKPDHKKEESEIKALKEEEKKKLKEVKETPGRSEADVVKEEIEKEYQKRIRDKWDTIHKKEEEWQKSQTEKFAKFCFTSTIPVRYNPTATCPRIDTFFKSLELSEDITEGIMELFGYCLLKSYPIKKMFLFVGPHDTAKSTIMSLLEAMLGIDNYSSLSLDALQQDHFEKKKLHRMHANISGELANRFIKDTSLLKELLGSDSVTARLMFSQKKFNFWNYAKLIFLANQIPATYETDNDFFPKVLIFEFTKQFKEGEERTIRKGELMAELTTEGEMSGLLNKAVMSLQELLKRGKFKTTKSEQENKELYLIKSNPFRYYIDNVLWFNNGVDQIDNPDQNLVRAYKQDVYNNFVTFCRRYNITGWTDNKFFRLMKKYAKEEGISEKRDTEGVWYYAGVSIRNLFPETENSCSDFDIDNL